MRQKDGVSGVMTKLPHCEVTWELERHLESATEAIVKFWQRHPTHKANGGGRDQD